MLFMGNGKGIWHVIKSAPAIAKGDLTWPGVVVENWDGTTTKNEKKHSKETQTLHAGSSKA